MAFIKAIAELKAAELDFEGLAGEDGPRKNAAAEKLSKFLKSQQKQIGFFTPFQNKLDFGYTLADPLVVPLVLGLTTGIAALVVATAAITAVGSLFVAGGAGLVGLFNNDAKQTAQNALTLAAFAGIVTAAAAIATVALAVITAISLPMSLLTLVTRSAATVVDTIANCMPSSKDEETVDFVPQF